MDVCEGLCCVVVCLGQCVVLCGVIRCVVIYGLSVCVFLFVLGCVSVVVFSCRNYGWWLWVCSGLQSFALCSSGWYWFDSTHASSVHGGCGVV